MADCVLALDQGTTSSRAILFGSDGRPIASAQEEFEQIYPQPGHVEHDPEAIWKTQLDVTERGPRAGRRSTSDVAAVGVTNQRETTIVWEKSTGKPVANAIVWQSRITAPTVRSTQSRRTGTDVSRANRSRRRRLFLRHQDRPPAGDDSRLAGPRREGGNPLRHGRQLLDLAADRRQTPRHRLQQRQPHADLQHPQARLGRRAACDPQNPARHAARGASRRATSTARRIVPLLGREHCRSPPTSATSRPPRSARLASSQGRRRTPTAQAASC